MDRRTFLLKSVPWLAGSLFSLNSFSRVLAGEVKTGKSFYPPRIALIIDDIGFSFSAARRFFNVEVPITFSILPQLPKSLDLAVEAHTRGHEVMLHQPMEPYNAGFDPGPGALYVGDKVGKIMRTVEKNLSDVPFVVGVNNHMGSKFTESRKEISETLMVVKKSDLFFVDSFTSGRSKAFKIARELQMISARRNIFLDNIPDESAILSQLQSLNMHARKFGCAIGIGHPFPETARAIERFSKGLEYSQTSLVHMSQILCT